MFSCIQLKLVVVKLLVKNFSFESEPEEEYVSHDHPLFPIFFQTDRIRVAALIEEKLNIPTNQSSGLPVSVNS